MIHHSDPPDTFQLQPPTSIHNHTAHQSTQSSTWAQHIKSTYNASNNIKPVPHGALDTTQPVLIDPAYNTAKPKRIRYKKPLSAETIEQRRIEQLQLDRRRANKPQKQLQTFSSLINFDVLEQLNATYKSSNIHLPYNLNTVQHSNNTNIHTDHVHTSNTKHNSSPQHNSKHIIGITGIDAKKANYTDRQSINVLVSSDTINHNSLDHNIQYNKMSKTRGQKKSIKPTHIRTELNKIHLEQYIRNHILQPIINNIGANDNIQYYKQRKQLKHDKMKLKKLIAKNKANNHISNNNDSTVNDDIPITESTSLHTHISTDTIYCYHHNQAISTHGVQPHIGLIPLIQSNTNIQQYQLSPLYHQYCHQLYSGELDELVIDLLNRLYTFYQRKYEYATNTKLLKKRYVSGLNEVYKKCKLSILQCIIISIDIEYDNIIKNGITELLSNIIQLAQQHNINVIYSCTRKQLSHALHIPHSKLSVIGIIDMNGAYDTYHKIIELRDRLHESYCMIVNDPMITLRKI